MKPARDFLKPIPFAHGDSAAAGHFIYTLNVVDIAQDGRLSGLCGEKANMVYLKHFKALKKVLPFHVRGFESDNGTRH